jgi:drug/metabolite transporter (DMT)-like permease
MLSYPSEKKGDYLFFWEEKEASIKRFIFSYSLGRGMNWILACLLMFIFSNVYYLIIRKAQLNKIENKLYMVANFTVPCLLFLGLSLISKNSLAIGLGQILVAFFGALLFNFIGSILSYSAMQKAPNPGYSLIIQKSNALYTTVAAIFLFGGEFSLRKFIGILVIIAFMVIISLPAEKNSRKVGSAWVLLSLVTLFCFGSNNLLGKYFGLLAVPTFVYLFWFNLFTAIFSIINLIINRRNVRFAVSRENLLLLFGIGVSVSLFYLFLQESIVLAPNVGYASAINASSIAMLTLLSALIFKDHLSTRKFIGVAGMIIGILLIVL